MLLRCATYSIECSPVSREKVANLLLSHASRGGGRVITEAAAEIARAAARSWLDPLFDTACDRLASVLGSSLILLWIEITAVILIEVYYPTMTCYTYT